MLEIDALAVGYQRPETIIVDQVSVRLEPGDFVCVIGRNGAGKSTMMRTICGLQNAISGTAKLDGRAIAVMSPRERAQAISIVTTERVSSPGLLARDVVKLGRYPYTDWRGQLSPADLDIVHESLHRAGAEAFAPKPFDSLSDGERQRVMIARALAQSSRLAVMDEITAFLDLPGRVEIIAMLRRDAAETGKIVLLSSHDLELSLELAQQIWIVHEGKLHHGDPDELVESGIIGNAFNSKGIMFNAAAKKFKT